MYELLSFDWPLLVSGVVGPLDAGGGGKVPHEFWYIKTGHGSLPLKHDTPLKVLFRAPH